MKTACNCPERRKPAEERMWFVTQHRWNSGAFTPGHGLPSDYSTVRCVCCGASFRTKAGYVDLLRHCTRQEANALEKKHQTHNWMKNGAPL